MTTAELSESHFLSRLAAHDAGRDGEPTQGVLAESEFFSVKEAIERVLGMAMLLVAAPAIALLIVLVRLNSRGPGVFKQQRVGKRGKVFTMYKLRSMRVDAEASTGPAWSPSGADPRTTRLGYWLRRLHLDELPQLWNVARGEMSLVGPRPERPEFVQILAEQIPGYLNRLMVQPGITGLAQINLPADTDLDSVRRKLMLDCEYIKSASWSLDVRIVLCTVLRVLWIRGPRVTRLLGLERTAILPDNHGRGGDNRTDQAAPVSLDSLTAVASPLLARSGMAGPAKSRGDRLAMQTESPRTAMPSNSP
jgi:lipopolysaccharide/colanic/teichoic acid biosynthesis glycosyltransferase